MSAILFFVKKNFTSTKSITSSYPPFGRGASNTVQAPNVVGLLFPAVAAVGNMISCAVTTVSHTRNDTYSSITQSGIDDAPSLAGGTKASNRFPI